MTKYSNPQVSIIIPVYNGEKYLERCLKSVLEQEYRDIEIIIIDDGSTDGSEYIYSKYKEIDKRIVILKQKNMGVSVARNKGIDIAKGKYIMFIDADDTIEVNMISKMVQSMKKNKTDISFCGFKVLGNNLRNNDTKALIDCYDYNNSGIIGSSEAIKRVISTNPSIVFYGYIWRNIFDAQIIKKNNIKFPEGIKISEDFMFLLEVLINSKNVSIIPEELYNYNINDNSVTAKYISNLHENMNYINQWMLSNICSKYPEILNGYNCCVANTYLMFIQNICRKSSPFKLNKKISLSYKVKKQFKYNKVIKLIWKNRSDFRKKAWIAIILFKFNLDWIYIILFTLKESKSN